MNVVRHALLISLVALACASSVRAEPAAAPAEVKQRCADSYKRAQELRLAERLLEARGELLQCADDACPTVAKSQCARWLLEVDEAIPSIVLQYVDAQGRDRRRVAVTLDGELLVKQLDGRPVRADPGVHQLRFAPADGPAVQRQVIIKAGEKNQLVTVRAPTAADPAAGSADTPARAAGESGSVHPATWVLAAVAVAGLAAFAGLGLHSLSLEDDCAPTCSDAQVDEVKAFRAGADVSLGVGALSLAGAVVVFVASWPAEPGGGPTEARSTRLPAPGGGLSVSWAF